MLSVPDAVIESQSHLPASESILLRDLPGAGAEIIASAPALAPVAKLVRSSHENYDGSGYPDGLAGDQIPLGSRILSVCVSYVVLTSKREDQRPLTENEALAELRRNAGKQFDPRVVEVLAEDLRGRRRVGGKRTARRSGPFEVETGPGSRAPPSGLKCRRGGRRTRTGTSPRGPDATILGGASRLESSTLRALKAGEEGSRNAPGSTPCTSVVKRERRQHHIDGDQREALEQLGLAVARDLPDRDRGEEERPDVDGREREGQMRG